MPPTFVTMKHPGIPGEVATATAQAFELIHQSKGWELIPDETLDLAAAAADTPPEDLKRPQLLALMESRGIAVPEGRPTNADLAAAIRAHDAADDTPEG